MKKKTAIVSLVGILISGMLIFVGCKHSGHHKGAEFMVDYVSEVLDLSDEQREDLDGIKKEFMEKAKDMHADKAAMKQAVMVQLESPQMDRDALKQLIDQHRGHMDDMIDLGLDRLIAFHQTLTPEQKAKLVSKLQDFDKWHHSRWE